MNRDKIIQRTLPMTLILCTIKQTELKATYDGFYELVAILKIDTSKREYKNALINLLENNDYYPMLNHILDEEFKDS
jgi:hypothetical protein